MQPIEGKVTAYSLPDLLVATDGTPVPDAATWRQKRRAELLDLFAREVYGRTPAGRPEEMHWEMTGVNRAALSGKAVRKEVTVWFTKKKDGPKMHLLIYQPTGSGQADGPWPTFLGLNFYGNQSVHADPTITISQSWMRSNDAKMIVNNRATEGSRGVSACNWEIEAVIARGFATATICYEDLCEDRVDGLENDVPALFNTGSAEERADETWGAIGVWAWGLSRALDYLASDPEIDASRVAVHGHSRLGKAALWAGAQDERFAYIISNNSGQGGASLSRRNFGETIEQINTAFPHWFAKNYRKYNQNVNALPVDQHALIALLAPRIVYVGSAVEDRWADPEGEFLATKHAGAVYRLFGKKALGEIGMPEVEHPVFGDGVAYHIRKGKHGILPYDWAQFLNFAERVWNK